MNVISFISFISNEPPICYPGFERFDGCPGPRSTASLDAAAMACCRARKWQEATRQLSTGWGDLQRKFSPENEGMSPENQWLVQMYSLLKCKSLFWVTFVRFHGCSFFFETTSFGFFQFFQFWIFWIWTLTGVFPLSQKNLPI